MAKKQKSTKVPKIVNVAFKVRTPTSSVQLYFLYPKTSTKEACSLVIPLESKTSGPSKRTLKTRLVRRASMNRLGGTRHHLIYIDAGATHGYAIKPYDGWNHVSVGYYAYNEVGQASKLAWSR